MRTAAHIIETVGKLVKKYDTRDPYELCKCLEIKIHFYNLEKKLKGFFFYQSRQKNIVILFIQRLSSRNLFTRKLIERLLCRFMNLDFFSMFFKEFYAVSRFAIGFIHRSGS